MTQIDLEYFTYRQFYFERWGFQTTMKLALA